MLVLTVFFITALGLVIRYISLLPRLVSLPGPFSCGSRQPNRPKDCLFTPQSASDSAFGHQVYDPVIQCNKKFPPYILMQLWHAKM